MKWDIKAILTLIAILVVGAAVCILALMMGPDIDEDSSSVLPENTTVSTLPTEAGSNENSSENSDDFKDEVANTTTNNKTDNMTTANSEPTQNNSSVTTTTNGTTSNKTTSKVTTTTTKKAPTTTKTQTTINSNTTFATYLAFVSDIQSGVYSLSQEPSALKELTPSCSCGIQFTGNFKDGSVKMAINGKAHQHTWSSDSVAVKSITGNAYTSDKVDSGLMGGGLWGNELGNDIGSGSTTGNTTTNINDSQTLYACNTCGFVKGFNFIYIHLPNASHGHGWSWANQPADPNTDVHSWKCGCVLLGDYYHGSFEIMLTGIMEQPGVGDVPVAHSHSWHQEKPAPTTTTTTKANSGSGGSGSVGSGSTGVPPCSMCNFRRWSSSDGFQRNIQFKCPTTGQIHQIITNGNN